MGLDMFLTKTRYLMENERQGLVLTFPNEPGSSAPKASRVREIIEEIMYWRKANAIHAWFVDNVQDEVDDCGTYHVEKGQLRELLALAKQVCNDHSLAPTLLPTRGGFFFGDIGYDEWYFQDLEETISVLESFLREDIGGWDTLEYHASW